MWERVAGRVMELEVGGGMGRVKEWDERERKGAEGSRSERQGWRRKHQAE